MELFFQKLVDESHNPVVFFRKDTLELVYYNQKALEMFGNPSGNLHLASIFPKSSFNLLAKQSMEEMVKNGESDLHVNAICLTNQGKEIYSKIQLGYGDEDTFYLQFSMEEKSDEVQSEIANYFNVIQSLSKDFLYRLNIKTRTLYRNESTAQLYGIASVVKDYPNETLLKGVFHPDDMEDYITFIQKVLKGVEGSITARMIAPSGNFEYHAITFKQLKEADGSVTEMIANAVNVHDLVKTEEKLSNINEYFNILQSLSRDLLYRLDIENRILYRNEQTSKFYGIPSEVHNYPDKEGLKEVFHPDDLEKYITYITKVMEGMGGVHTARMVAPSGLFEYHRITFRPLTRADGSIKEMVGTAENIQELMELETKASFDLLTKCYNKVSFQEEVGKILAEQKQGKHALLFLDLDEFKYVNDHLGHSFGDLVIKELGKRLRDSVAKGDFVGRVGGDEFVLFFQNVDCPQVLLGRAKMLLRTIGEDICDSTHCHSMHGSIGIALFPEHGTTYEQLYHHADVALYQSKNKGKNTATLYEQ